MTAKYFAILTNQGAARLANAAALGTRLNLTQMAVGDANGTLPTPDPAQTKLINQKRIAPLNLLTVDPANTSQIIAEQIIPENEGGFWIREIGLYDDDGILIAVANCPETYKPQLQEGSGRTQTIRMILIVSSTSSITLKIDPSVVLATRKYADDKAIELKLYVDDLMSKHLAAADPHSQYAKKDSPTFTGKPKAPTPPVVANDTQVATAGFVQAVIAALVSGELANKQPMDKTLTDLSGKDVAAILEYLGLDTAIAASTAPLPDVWLPINDGMQMNAGFGPYDRINIGTNYLELNTRSATFTRASAATYIDKSGVLQTAAINEPRFEKEGLLIEGQSTNLFSKANNTSFTLENLIGGSQVDVAYPHPGCGGICKKITSASFSAGSTKVAGATLRTLAIPDGVDTFTLSVYVYADDATLDLLMGTAALNTYINGTVAINSNAKTLIRGNGYIRGIWVLTIASGTSRALNTIQINWKDQIKELTITNIQFEALPFPTSYIATNGAEATRAAEGQARLQFSGNFPSDVTNNGVTVAMQVDNKGIAPGKWSNIFFISQLSPTGSTRIVNKPDGTLTLQIGTQSVDVSGVNVGASNIVGFVVNGKKVKIFVNGIFSEEITLTSTITYSTSTVIRLGGTESSDPQFGHIRNMRIWHRALTDAQLKSIK